MCNTLPFLAALRRNAQGYLVVLFFGKVEMGENIPGLSQRSIGQGHPDQFFSTEQGLKDGVTAGGGLNIVGFKFEE